jgi:hypothetical protein
VPAPKLLLFEEFEINIWHALAPGFQKAGFQTHLVSSVDGCVRGVRTVPPDVVLMITNNIHEECAFAVAVAIRALHPKCSFVFVAGNPEDGRGSFLAAGYKFNVHSIPAPMRDLIAASSQAIDSPMKTFVAPKAADSSCHCDQIFY